MNWRPSNVPDIDLEAKLGRLSKRDRAAVLLVVEEWRRAWQAALADANRRGEEIRDLRHVLKDQQQHIRILEDEKLASMREPLAKTEAML